MPAPVDLIYLAPGLGTGGTERHLAWLLPALQKRGLRLEVWNTGEEGDAEKRLRQSGVTVRRRRAPVSLRQVGRLAALTAGLARLRPRLVHSYLYAHHWLDAVACRLAGTTYVGSRRNLAHWRQGPVLARERWRDRVSAVIIANSAAAAAVAVTEGTDPGRLRVIPNGVPLPSWAEHAWTDHEDWMARRRDARDALGLPDDARVVGAVMSLKPIKDPVTLVKGFAGRAGLRPGDRLVFIGEGPLAPELRSLAGSLGVAEQLVLAGRRAEPLELLAALDLFCLPSHSEGCSNAILEAMAAALPVVTTDAGGGNHEAVVAGETGRLVPAGDSTLLAAALDDLLANPDAARRLGQAGRRRARERFSLDTMVQQHVDLYAEVMAGSRSRVA
ncbi:MAG: glycosyltransferase [Acidobacteria bacterium]|nr:glycosyltransferase [Acidobacteriota bacterium]